MVISTGTTLPRMDSVCALYALQNSMMLTPCGPSAVPTGGAGVAAPAWSCTLTRAAIFFLGGMVLGSLRRGAGWFDCGAGSDLLDLVEAQLDRGLPAEDLDEGLDPLRLGVDLGDRRVQRGERSVHHHDRVGHGEVGDLDLLAGGRAAARALRGRGLGLGGHGRGEHALDLL